MRNQNAMPSVSPRVRHFLDAAAVWQQGTCERCVEVQRIRLDNAWLLALMPQGNGQSLRSLPPGPLARSAAARGHVDLHIGTQMRITGLPPSRKVILTA